MRVSIVIPVYNVEDYIGDCLQSVMRQKCDVSIECLLIDDCGTDRSVKIAEEMIAQYGGQVEFKVLHHERNRGLSAARNTGIDAAIGDYVFFLDSDDWISDDCIDRLVQPLSKEPVDIVVGDFETVGEFPYLLNVNLPDGLYREKGISKTFCNQGIYVMAVNKLYRKGFLDDNRLRFEEGKIHEDEIFAFDLSFIDKSFSVVNAETYFYRIRSNSIITQQDPYKKLGGYLGVLDSVESKVNQHDCFYGIWDYYMFWVRRVFGWFERVEMDEEMYDFVNGRIKGYLDFIPSLLCLHDKHNRLLYLMSKREQTIQHYYYITNFYGISLPGRIMRNVLGLLPNTEKCSSR